MSRRRRAKRERARLRAEGKAAAPERPATEEPPEKAPAAAQPGWWAVPLLVAGVAFLLRLANGAFLIASDPTVGLWTKGFDMANYHTWAQDMAAGDWLNRERGTFYYNALYVHTLAPLYALFGSGVWVGVVWNAALSALACGFTAATAQRLLGPWAGVISGSLLALAAPSMYVDAHTLPESLAAALAAVTLWSLVLAVDAPGRWGRWLGAGAAGALLSLARGSGLVVMGIVWWGLVIWLWRRRADHRRWWLPPLALLGGMAAVIIPSMVRNGLVGGRWAPITTNGPVNWLMGNTSDATGLFGYSALANDAMKRHGLKMSMGEALAAAGETWRDAPLELWGVLGRKVTLLLSDDEWADNYSFRISRRWSPLTRWSPVTFGLLLALAAGALAAVRPRGGGALWLVWLWVGATLFSVWLFFISGRFRISLFPSLCVLGAAGLTGLATATGRRRGAWVTVVVAVAALSFFAAVPLTRALCLGQLSPLRRSGWPTDVRVNDYANVAAALVGEGRIDDTVVLLNEAIESMPNNESLRLRRLQMSYEHGRPASRLADLEWMVRARPSDPQFLYLLGVAQWQGGDFLSAEASLAAALSNNPPPNLPVRAALSAVRARQPPPQRAGATDP